MQYRKQILAHSNMKRKFSHEPNNPGEKNFDYKLKTMKFI